ncbi:hypothetical protein [Ferroacidibacillus organovorans]|uniref:Uncharacterized protein n=1 Tax=Ferroacidibacillus organovorans TaxID=1765683 RepID=A0A853K8V6_9BACL|nr:hypothetical protein [Ferroacidibacillus organovorans]KYP80326.1 hypothetical protein AYJ22_11630 [Ferroacidibacillus organovorans]OAG93257.1 hypothetical protein AYW79_11550 [Ferroacidibacillus organovorans]
MTWQEFSMHQPTPIKTYHVDGCTMALYEWVEKDGRMPSVTSETAQKEGVRGGRRESRACETSGVLSAQVARR